MQIFYVAQKKVLFTTSSYSALKGLAKIISKLLKRCELYVPSGKAPSDHIKSRNVEKRTKY